jgi:alpha-tubulin suppressor-like RCC1 family protein
MEALKQAIPGIQMDFDTKSGAPSRVQATGRFLTPPAPGKEAVRVVSDFIDQHPALFGHSGGVLTSSRITREDVSAHNGMTTLVWNQEVEGIPVFQTILKANVAKTGQLITMSDHYLAAPIPQTRVENAKLTAPEAITAALATLSDSVNGVTPSGTPEGPERKQPFTAAGISDTTAQLTYMPMDDRNVRAAWDITSFSLAQNEMFRFVIDAVTGELLYRQSLTADISDATYRVYADSVTKQPVDSPMPLSPSHSTPSSVQPAEVPRQIITLDALDTTASPEGWVPDGGTTTVGNNVEAHTDTNADNLPDLPRPTSPTRNFDFPVDFNQSPTAYKEALVTQLFYMNNWVHDKLYAMGFTESAGNFQTNNFGRGGSGNDAVQADAQDGSGTNNANFSTPADGSPGRMQMFIWTSPDPDRDSDFDNEIIIHEYGHGVSNRLVGGGVGISALQSRGMGEGWSDFLALALLSQPGDDINGQHAKGGYSTYLLSGMTTNYYFGIRRYPYGPDLSKSPLTYKDIDTQKASAHPGIPLSPRYSSSNATPSQFHAQGEVWCNMLWEVRRNLVLKHGFAVGNPLALQIVIDGMKLSPGNPTFLQARDAILQADLVNNGGTNLAQIWAGFAKRGLGVSTLGPVNSITEGTQEAYDVPGTFAVAPVGGFSTIGIPGGPFSVTSQTLTLTNNSGATINWTAGKTQAWTDLSASSGTLAAGASTSLTWSLNAGANSLGVQEHLDTLTITDTTNNLVQARPLSVIVNGSPVAQTITFPAIGPKATTAAPFALTATASSGLPVTYSVLNGPASISGSTVTLTGATGAVTIKASQAGNALYLPASDVIRSFVVGTNSGFARIYASPNNAFSYALKPNGTFWSWGGAGSSSYLGDTSPGRIAATQIGTVTSWTALVPGSSHGLGLRADGSLWAWGSNFNGQVGDGTTISRTAPVQIGPATNWSKIAAGSSFSVAIKTDGTLWAWGVNTNGQLGDGTTVQKTSPQQVGLATNWTEVACGFGHVVAVNSLGELWAWGSNSSGQFGNGTNTSATTPIQIGTFTDWQKVYAANNQSYAIKTNGTLWAWGLNNGGSFGDGTTASRSTPGQVGTDTWLKVAAGLANAAGIRSDGTAWVWGTNTNGQLGNGTTTNSSTPIPLGTGGGWQDVAVGLNFVLALDADGTCWAAGEAAGGTGVSPRALTMGASTTSTWLDASATGAAFHLIRSDRTLWGWGSNNNFSAVGTGGSPTEVRALTQIGTAADWQQISGRTSSSNSAGSTMAVKTTGTLWGWGANFSNQLGDGTTTTRSAPVQIGTDSNWSQVGMGGSFGTAIKTNGTLWTWGNNGNGQLGDGTTVAKTAPTQQGVATDWAKVAVVNGNAFAYAIKTNGTLWAWGFNGSGQLGDGTTVQKTSPVQVGSATNWGSVAAGSSHAVALRSDGTLWTWGLNTGGQLGSGNFTSRFSPGQVGTATDWVKVYADGNMTAAVKTNGTLWVFGDGPFGQLGIGITTAVNVPTQIGTENGYSFVTLGYAGIVAVRNGLGIFTGGASSGSGLLAGGRDTRVRAPTLPALLSQSINSPAPNYNIWESPVTITATSGLAPTIAAVTGPASVSNNTLALSGGGTVSYTAFQYGDDSAWNAAVPVRHSFTVNSTLAATFPAPGSIGLTSNGFNANGVVLNPTLGFAPALGTLLTLVNNTSSSAIIGFLPGIPDGGYMTMTFGGVTYGFRVDYQGGDGNDIVLTHEQSPQTIALGRINPKETTDAPFTLNGTVTGNLPISYSIVTGPATVSGSTITLTGAAGAVTVKASQAGNGLFFAAPDVLQTFAVGPTAKFATISVTNGTQHTLAVTPAGRLWAWGFNTSGQLGDGTSTTRLQPLQIGTATDWARVAAGNGSSLGIKTNGQLWGWGASTTGQLGDGSTSTRFSPVQIGTLTTWSQVSAGTGHSLAIRTNGTLWATGSNTSGQVGNGTTSNVLTWTQIGTDTDWAEVTALGTSSFAIKTNGTLYAWGLNSSSQLGLGDTTNRSVPTQIGTATNWKSLAGATHVLAVRTDGTLWAWGSNVFSQLGDGTATTRSTPVQIGTQTDWNSVSGSSTSSYALKTNGQLWAWGSNSSGQLGDGTFTTRTTPTLVPGVTTAQAVQASSVSVLIRLTDGTLWSLGDPTNAGMHPRGLTRAMPSGTNSSISAGSTHNLLTTSSGNLWAFGSGTSGQLGHGSFTTLDPTQIGTVTTWQSVKAGSSFSHGIRTDGTLWGWGTNSSNQLGDGTVSTRSSPFQIGTGTDWAAVAPAPNNSFTMAVKTGGTLWAWGTNTSGQHGDGTITQKASPTQIGVASDWSRVASGSLHTLALKTNGTLWAAGLNSNGQLGDGTTTSKTTLFQVGTATDWAAVATFGSSSFAIKTDGTLWAWGINTNGVLGDGSTTQRTAPVQVGTDTDWLQVSTGINHTAAVKTDGSLWTWGTNSGGELGDGTTTNQLAPVQVGDLTGWVAVAAGSARTLALRNDGSVWACGNGNQLRVSSKAGRAALVPVPVLPQIYPQTINTTPVGTNPYRFTSSSGLPVQISVVSGQATVTGDEVNVTGPPGAPVVLTIWQPGDEYAWNAAGPHQVVLGTLTAPTIDSIAHTNVDGSGADLTAVVNANNVLTTLSFQYGTDPALDTFSTTSGQSVGSGGASSTSPVFSISGLSQATTYYYRALATSAGGSTTSSIQSFTTLLRDIAIEQPSGTPRISGATVAFGDVNLGSSGTQSFTVKSLVPGTAITLGVLTLTGADAGMFSLNTTGMSSSISGGASTSFSVSFTPTLSGARTAILTIPNNDPDENPFTFVLAANGLAQPGPTQTILGPSTLPSRFVSDGAFVLPYVASSGLPLTYSVVGGTGGSVSGSIFTPSGAGGPVTVLMTQAGGSGYDAAAPIYRTFSVAVGKFTYLSAGPMANHGVGIKADGTLWTWGRNSAGQLGNGTTNNSAVPTQVGSATTWARAAAGAEFTVAVRSNGTLWAWGKNTDGQLGLGDNADRTTPVQVGVGTTWNQVAAGANFVIAVQTNGTLWAWGGNASSQLGLGDTVSRTSPVQIGTATNWTSTTTYPSIAAGNAHAIARNTSSQLFAWGLNSSGQLGVGDASNRTTPTQVGTSTGWGKVACGANTTAAIQSTTAGALYAWGANNLNQVGDGTATNRTSPVQIGTASTSWASVVLGGSYSGLAVRSDLSLYAWGSPTGISALGFGDTATRSTPQRVGLENTWTVAATGVGHSAALKADGTLWTSGDNVHGQLAHPAPGLTWIAGQVVAHSGNSFASHYIRSDGTMWGFGTNNSAELGDGTSTPRPVPVQIGVATNWSKVAGGFPFTLAMRTDGTLWAAGLNTQGQLGDGTTTQRLSFTQIGTDSDWADVAAGNFHGVAIKSNGTLWAWGLNSNGQLGDGTTTNRLSPVQIGGATDWVKVACGASNTLALRSDGSLWAWGINSSGTLGDGTTTQRNAPVRIGTDNNWAQVSAGTSHSLALKSDGSLWSWGFNSSGQVGDGTTTTRSSPVQVGVDTNWLSAQAGASHTVATKTNGTAWAWGSNDQGQLGLDNYSNQTSPTPVVPAVNAWTTLGTSRGSHTMMVTADGSLWATGANGSVQVTNLARHTSAFDYAHPGTATQTITFPPVQLPAYNTPVPLAATASSGLPVSYYVSGPGTVSNNVLTVTGPGEVKLLAYQAGLRPSWHPTAVVQASFVLQPQLTVEHPAGTPLVDATTSVDFGSVKAGTNGQTKTITLANTGLNNLSITSVTALGPWSVTAPLSTTVTPGTATTFTATFTPSTNGPLTGTLRIVTNDPNNTTFDIPVTGKGLIPQTITFGAIADQTYLGAFNLGATASSLLPVSYSVSGPASLTGNMLTFTGVGSVTVEASQGGDADYAAADNVSRTFSVNPAPQSISFNPAPPASISYAGSVNLSAGSSAGLTPITYSLVSGPGIVTGSTLTFSGPGTVVVSASHPGTTLYQPGSVQATVQAVNLPPQANSAAFATVVDAPITASVTGQDTESNPLTFSVIVQPTHGTLSFTSADGSFTYQPDSGYSGTDFFTFTANDGTSDSTVARVDLIVRKMKSDWTWIGGSNLPNQLGQYTTPPLSPGARSKSATWTTADGRYWLFGGEGYGATNGPSYLGDLWSYAPTSQTWSHVKGRSALNPKGVYGTKGAPAPENTPGGRTGAVSLTDSDGRLWLFGGQGRDSVGRLGYMSDLWCFDPVTSQWTWVAGTPSAGSTGSFGTKGLPSALNAPSGRTGAAGWLDLDGNLWVFGGHGFSAAGGAAGALSDLWKYSIADGTWTWMHGEDGVNRTGIYDLIKVPTSTVRPGGRSWSATWVSNDGRLLLFGGHGYANAGIIGYLDDVWAFEPESNSWSWQGGSSHINTPAVADDPGTPATEVTPGGRSSSTAWLDATGAVWIYGGHGPSGQLSDVWSFHLDFSHWARRRSATDTLSHGTLGVSSPSNSPGPRRNGLAFVDRSAGSLILFGGNTLNQSFSDLWTLDQPAHPKISDVTATIVGSNIEIRAKVNPTGMPTRAFVEHGLGSTTPVALGNGTAPVELVETLPIPSDRSYLDYQIIALVADFEVRSPRQRIRFTTTSTPSTVSLSVTAQTMEGQLYAPITVTLDAPATSPITIPLSYSGTAILGIDTAPLPASLSFVVGQTSAVTNLFARTDSILEGPETVIVTLGTLPPGLSAGSAISGTTVIQDYAGPPEVEGNEASRIVTLDSALNLAPDYSKAGSLDLTFEWRKNGNVIRSQTSPTLSLPRVRLSDAGTYTLTVINELGSATSPDIVILVVDTAATSLVLDAGMTSVLRASASGPGIQYQWMNGTTPIPGATSSTLTLANVTPGNSGTYWCAISTSAAAGVTGRTGDFTVDVFFVTPEITTPLSLPRGVVGGDYSYFIPYNPDPRRAPTSFIVFGLPIGLTVSPQGEITGRTTAPLINRAITITARNAKGPSASVSTTITILPLPANLPGAYIAKLDRLSPGDFGGKLDLSVSANGFYTGRMIQNRVATPLGGRLAVTLDDTGASPVFTLAVSTTTPVPINLSFDTTAMTVNGTTNGAATSGYRKVWKTSSPATAYLGYHTFAAELAGASVGDVTIPQGTSIGSYTVSSMGTASLTLNLSDGDRGTATTFVGPEGQLVVYSAALGGGSVLGMPTLTAAPGSNVMSGTLTWNKPASTATAYAAGFPPLDLTVTGGRYVRPAAGQLFLNLPAVTGNAILTLTSPELAATPPPPVSVTIGPLQVAAPLPPNATGLTLRTTASNGRFRGSNSLLAPISQVVNYKGIIIRDGSAWRSVGHFLFRPGTAPDQLSAQATLSPSP